MATTNRTTEKLDRADDAQSLAAVAATILEWQWPGLTAEENRIMPRLLLGLYRGTRQGKTFNKTEAAGLMGLEVGKTAAKYINLAIDRGWVTIDRWQGRGGRAQDHLKPKNELFEIVEAELAKLQLALTTSSITSQISYQAGESSFQRASGGGDEPQSFCSPEELRPFALQAAELVEAFHRPNADRRSILQELTARKCFAMSARLQLTDSHSDSWIASLNKRWEIVSPHKPSGTVQYGLLQRLFFRGAKTLNLFPGTDHFFHHNAAQPDNRQVAHPDDLEAAHLAEVALRPLSTAPVRPIPGLFAAPNLDGCLVVFGGGTSNALTRLIFEERKTGSSGDFVSVNEPTLNLRYVASSASDEPVVQITAKEFEPRFRLRDRLTGEFLLPKMDAKGRLLQDILLVTVVPNFLSSESYKRGEKIVLLGGTHGVGTLASSLLWFDETILRTVADQVDDAIAWQAVIETTNVGYAEKRPRAASLGRLIGCAHLDVDAKLDTRFILGSSRRSVSISSSRSVG